MGENDRLERELGHVNQQLEKSEQINAQFQRRIAEPEQVRPALDTSFSQRRIAELEQVRPATDTSFNPEEQRTDIKLTWVERGRAPCKMSSSYCAAVDSSTLYVRVIYKMLSYTINTFSWSQLPDSPTRDCPLVIINNLLTLVGGVMVVVSSPTSYSASLGRAVVGGGLRNSHPCKQYD